MVGGAVGGYHGYERDGIRTGDFKWCKVFLRMACFYEKNCFRARLFSNV